jgi:glycosyltransferase involved in cell wall biosynthesis
VPEPDDIDFLLEPETVVPELRGYRRAQRAWRSLPIPRPLRWIAAWLIYRFSRQAQVARAAENELAILAPILPRPAAEIPPGPLVVSGLFGEVSGIARGGRMSLAAFRAAGLDPIVHDWRREPLGWGAKAPGGVWFAHYNPPEARAILQNSPDPRGCYRVGYWAWELPELPGSWAQLARLYHEVWAPSTFVADAIRRATAGLPLIIRVQPHPLPDLAGVTPDRARFGLRDGVFAFLGMFDVLSSPARKNPMGAVQAFQRAFPPDRADVELVVKVVTPDHDPARLAILRAAVAGWPNIRLLVERLSDTDADRLIASADAFVSLHRSEGFGLSIAAAMALGRPVVVTGWSGNMDFCGEGAIAVGYRLVPVDDPSGVYAGDGQVWAEPDLDEAAAAMRRLADDPAAARALGEAARAHVTALLTKAYDADPLRPWLA